MLSSQKHNRKEREEVEAIIFKAETRNNSWKCYRSGFSIFIYWSFHIKTGCLGRDEWVTRSLGSLLQWLCSCLKVTAKGFCFSMCQAMCSLSRDPIDSYCGKHSLPTCTAPGCQEGCTPILHGASGCALCGEMIASVPHRRGLQSKDSLQKTHLPGQYVQNVLTISSSSFKACMSWDPKLQATALH